MHNITRQGTVQGQQDFAQSIKGGPAPRKALHSGIQPACTFGLQSTIDEDDFDDEDDEECDDDDIDHSEWTGGDDAEEVVVSGVDNQEPIVEGSTIEVKYLEKRFGKNGRQYVKEFIDDEGPTEDKSAWFERFVLCVTLNMDRENKFIQFKTVAIHSPFLKSLLNDVIGDAYPGVSYSTKNLSVNLPANSLFHYRTEIEQEAATRFAGNTEAAAHAQLLLKFIREEFKDTIEESDNLIEQGKITYQHLWTILRPRSTIVTNSSTHPRAYKLSRAQYICAAEPFMRLDVTHTDFDGHNFGTKNAVLEVYPWRGVESISSLSAFPIEFHPEEKRICQRLVERGRKFEQLAGQHFQAYTGTAISMTPCDGRISLNGRVMIDTRTAHRIVSDAAFKVTAFKDPESDTQGTSIDQSRHRRVTRPNTSATATQASLDDEAPRALQPLTDDQALSCNSLIPGFCFTNKKFLYFAVDLIKPIIWNDSAFSQLVLPAAHKSTVRALVSMHTKRAHSSPSSSPSSPSNNTASASPDKKSNGGSFDDIVKGKGKGLVLVLHGPPGVGKTLTAECVAEYAHRPLYIISSGDLGTNSELLDARLTATLDLASTFKAVLLIDEADVFLSKRTLHDLERNALVAIFLRTLEYYEGILFLTSNRIRDFDDAFKSRIHIPLRYGELPASSRKAIWRNFLHGPFEASLDAHITDAHISDAHISDADTTSPTDSKETTDSKTEEKQKEEKKCKINEAGLEKLSQAPLNGRQIKNVVRTAISLAEYEGKELDLEQVETVLGIQMEFEREMGNGNGNGEFNS